MKGSRLASRPNFKLIGLFEHLFLLNQWAIFNQPIGFTDFVQ